jgi:hypothetical protein
MHRALLLVLVLAACSSDEDAPAGGQPADSVAQSISPDTITMDLPPGVRVPVDCNAASDAANRDICPGQRVGAITANTTRADLARIYGVNAVRDDSVYVGEGMFEPGSWIKLATSDSIAIIWRDSTRTQIRAVNNLSSAWRTREGVRIGSTLREVATAFPNAQILGYGWDYGGTILLPEDHPAYGKLILRTASTATAPPQQSIARIRGDQPFALDDPDVLAIKPVVSAIAVQF